MAKNGVDQSWEECLTPEILRNKLISASLYLAAFEMLKDSVVGRLRSFYTFGYDKNGDRIDPQYEQRVLNRNRSTLYASLSWLAESTATAARSTHLSRGWPRVARLTRTTSEHSRT